MERRDLPSFMPIGSEFLVNSFVSGNQGTFPATRSRQAVAMDADGDFVVVWSSYGQDSSGYGVYAQRYNSAGNAVGFEFPVNLTTFGNQSFPSVAMDDGGDFVVTWDSLYQDGSAAGVFGRRFDAFGVAQGGEFQVNQFTSNGQGCSNVAMDADGDFVVVWESYGQDFSGTGVYARRYDRFGNSLSGEFLVNSNIQGNQGCPAVAMDADGDFVVVWESFGYYQDGSGTGVYAQRYNAAGVSQGFEFLVNSATFNNQILPNVAMDDDGDFVVTWSSYGQDGSGFGVFAQRYNSAGLPQGFEFLVNTYTASTQGASSVTLDADGDFVIAWESYAQDFSGFAVNARRYSAAGVPETSGEVLVNTTTFQNQRFPSVAAESNGDFVVVWSGNGFGDDAGVFGQRFGDDTPPANRAPTLSFVGNRSVDEGQLLSFRASASDPDGHALTYSLDPGAPAGASIDAVSGIFAWAPSELQGPADTSITVRVTDNGSPPLSAAETFSVNVREVNQAPVLAAIGNRSVDKGQTLTFTATATDADRPANALTFSLDAGAPAGANINATSGVFTWTPGTSQGPGDFPITVRVTDNGSSPLSDFETITVSVTELNRPPVLDPIGNQAVNEGSLLSFTVTATDPDQNLLTFSLAPGAPPGASINPTTGLFRFTPTESQGPASFSVTVRVTDNGPGNLVDSETISVMVQEVNQSPQLQPVGTRFVNPGGTLQFTVQGTDADVPANRLAYTLDNAPNGVSIDAASGTITVASTATQTVGTTPITVRVSDDGTPPQSDSELFDLVVTLDVSDTLAGAKALPFNAGQAVQEAETLGNSAAGAGDVDLFRITLQTGDLLSVDIDAADLDSGEVGVVGLDSILRLFDPSGVELAFNDDAINPTSGVLSPDPLIEFTVPRAGEYYIGVSSYPNRRYSPSATGPANAGRSTGDYLLTVLVTRAASTSADVSDKLVTAMPLNVTPDTPAVLTSIVGDDNPDLGNKDVDLFQLELNAGDILSADIDAAEIGLSQLNAVLRLFRRDSNDVVRLATSGDANDPDTRVFSRDPFLEYGITQAGSYVLGVSAEPNATYDPRSEGSGVDGMTSGRYRLTVRVSQRGQVVEAGDTLGAARGLPTLERGQGTLFEARIGDNPAVNPPRDIDLFRLTLDTGDILTADVDAFEIGLSRLDSVLRIFDSAGREVARNDDANDADSGSLTLDSTVQFGAPAAGTYYVGVSSHRNSSYDPADSATGRDGDSEGDYRLTVRLDRPDPSAPGGGTSDQPEQVVWLNFEGGSQPGGFPYDENVPPFSPLPFGVAVDQRDALVQEIQRLVRLDFTTGTVENPAEPLNLAIDIGTTPPAARPYMTVFVGGDCGFLGISQGVDTDNRNINDHARVCTDKIARELPPGALNFNSAALAIADTISHEIGHNVGLRHLDADADGYLMQSGALDAVRNDDEQFGHTGRLEDMRNGPMTQDDVAMLRRNLRPRRAASSADGTSVFPAVGQALSNEGQLQFVGDSDVYSVPLDAGDEFRIDLDANELFRAGTQFLVTVTDPRGNSVANSVGIDPESGFPGDPFVIVRSTVSGTYTVRVSAVFFGLVAASPADPDPETRPAGRYRVTFHRDRESLATPLAEVLDGIFENLDLVAKNGICQPGSPVVVSDASGDQIEVSCEQEELNVFVESEGLRGGRGDISRLVITGRNLQPAVVTVRMLTAGGTSRIGDIVVQTDQIGTVRVIGVDSDRITVRGGIDRLMVRNATVHQQLFIGGAANRVLVQGGAAAARGLVTLAGHTNLLKVARLAGGGTIQAASDIGRAVFGSIADGSFQLASGRRIGELVVQSTSTGRFDIQGSVDVVRFQGSFGETALPLGAIDVEQPGQLAIAGHVNQFVVQGDLRGGVVVGQGIDCLQVFGAIDAEITGRTPLGCSRDPLAGALVERTGETLRSPAGDIWNFTVARAGVVTAELFSNDAAANLDLELYRAGTLVAAGRERPSNERVDIRASGGEVIHVRILSANATSLPYDLRISNVLNVRPGTGGPQLDVRGTPLSEQITVAGSASEVESVQFGVEGALRVTSYDAATLNALFGASPPASLRVRGAGGNDRITIDARLTITARLLGQEGNDTLQGGGGNDLLDGGPGFDRCVQGGGTGSTPNCESLSGHAVRTPSQEVIDAMWSADWDIDSAGPVSSVWDAVLADDSKRGLDIAGR